MTRIYFVRHAKPDHSWSDDRTRPLTTEGKKDSEVIVDFFKDKKVDVFYSSPYKRSMDTIANTALTFQKEILTDERLRERECGTAGNNYEMMQKRWADFNYHEAGGESLHMVQERNMSVLTEILLQNQDKNIVIATHGTALSTILAFYDRSFDCKAFMRIIDWMPYVIELDYEGTELVDKKEHLHIEKPYKI